MLLFDRGRLIKSWLFSQTLLPRVLNKSLDPLKAQFPRQVVVISDAKYFQS